MEHAWPQLLHRKITAKLIDELNQNYPDIDFEIMTIFEKKESRNQKVISNRVRIYTDTDGVVVRIPTNG